MTINEALRLMGPGKGGLAGMMFGVGAVIVLPIIYGVLGAVFGAIGAFLYNVLAASIGGIEFETE